MKNFLFTCPIFCLLLFGCQRVLVHVDSINDPQIHPGKRYVLLSGMKGIAVNDLQFKEFASYVNKAMAIKGYKLQKDMSKPEDSDLIIFLSYGIGNPTQTNYSFSMPIYGQVGGGTSTFNSLSYGSSGSLYSTGTITTPPRYGVVGTNFYSGSLTRYFRYFMLDAFNIKSLILSQKEKNIVPAWRTTATSIGTSDDLRFIFPYLVAASMDYIGLNTDKSISKTLYLNNGKVKVLIGNH